LIERAEKNEKKLALDNQILSEMAKNAGWLKFSDICLKSMVITPKFFKMKSHNQQIIKPN
jgi:hypothetical protein